MRVAGWIVFVALACGSLFATACGHSEEEMQAAIARARMQCATSAPSVAAATNGCTKDTDCKGDRVCSFGRCSAP